MSWWCVPACTYRPAPPATFSGEPATFSGEPATLSGEPGGRIRPSFPKPAGLRPVMWVGLLLGEAEAEQCVGGDEGCGPNRAHSVIACRKWRI
jgi:hypothetical protein